MAILPKAMRPRTCIRESQNRSVRPRLMLVFASFSVSPIRVHHTPRPIQRLGRTTATENHEIIGVVDKPGLGKTSPRPVIRQ